MIISPIAPFTHNLILKKGFDLDTIEFDSKRPLDLVKPTVQVAPLPPCAE